MVQALAQVITFKEGELYPKLLLFLSLHILLVTVSVDSVFWIVLDMTNPLHSCSAGYWHFSLGPMQSPHGPFLCLCSCTSNPISASQFLSKWKLEDVMCFLKMLKLLRWNLSFLTWCRSLQIVLSSGFSFLNSQLPGQIWLPILRFKLFASLSLR